MQNYNKTYNLGWGDPVVVRQALFKYYQPTIKIVDNAYSYVNNNDYDKMVEFCRILNKKLFNISYKYNIITVGAMQALQALMWYYKGKKYTSIKTSKLYFPYYQHTSKRNGLVFNSKAKKAKHIVLVDSPSNPQGRVHITKSHIQIWDAVYNNPIYKSLYTPPLNSETVIGSFGKLFGLSGFRLGWIATDNEEIAEFTKQYVETNTCGLPAPSIAMIIDLLPRYLDEWGSKYEILAKRYIDNNREEVSKISNIFDNQPVSTSGMFYFPKTDEKAKKLLEKCGIVYVDGSKCGDKESIRLNLAQDNEITKKAIQIIKKEDLCHKRG